MSVTYRKPIVIEAGELEQIQSVDGLDVGGYQLPPGAGAAKQVLALPASGTVLEWVDPDVAQESLTNANANPILIGAPVYLKADGTVDLAEANAQATTDVFGLVKDTSIAAGDPGNILTDGTLTALTTDWDAVTGGSGGLTPGAVYFLDPATAGLLTASAPTTAGQFVVRVGKAISATKMDLVLAAPIKL
jgi:hypothetical protein